MNTLNIRYYSAALTCLLLITAFFSCKKDRIEVNEINLYTQAKSSYLKGDLLSAENILNNIYTNNKKFYQAGFLLGKTLYLQEKTPEAYSIFTELIKNFPAFNAAQIWLVRTEMQMDYVEKAEKRLKTLLSFDSQDPRLLYLMAGLYKKNNDIKNALSFYQKAELFGDEFAKIFLETGRIYYKFNMNEKALSDLSRCLSLLSGNSPMFKPVETLIDRINKEIE